MALQCDYLERGVGKNGRWERIRDSYSMPVDSFVSMHAVERIESISRVVAPRQTESRGTTRIPFGGFRDVIDLPQLDNNRILFRWGGMQLQVRGAALFLEPDVVFEREKGYFTFVNSADGQERKVASAGLCIGVVPVVDAGTASLPVDRIVYPLIVRSRRGGDAIHLGASSKDLKKLYGEWKVPSHEKWKIAVCEDRKGIAAVLGSPFGFKDIKRPDLGSSEAGKALAFRLC